VQVASKKSCSLSEKTSFFEVRVHVHHKKSDSPTSKNPQISPRRRRFPASKQIRRVKKLKICPADASCQQKITLTERENQKTVHPREQTHKKASGRWEFILSCPAYARSARSGGASINF